MLNMDPDGAQCSDVRALLKEIDPLFEVSFNYETEKYHVEFNGGLFETVHYQDLDRKFFSETKHTYWLNCTGGMTDYVDDGNAAYEALEDRRLTDMARSLAEDMRKPLVQSHYY